MTVKEMCCCFMEYYFKSVEMYESATRRYVRNVRMKTLRVKVKVTKGEDGHKKQVAKFTFGATCNE